MRRILQRLLLPIALVAVTQTNIVSAESIRLTGPNGEIQSSSQYSEQITRPSSSVASEPSRFYGPTTKKETLWGVASRLKPSKQVSVQQTLLAIYQLNPQAFDNQNIHTMLPGSTIRVPSLAQVNSVSTDEAVRIMNLHQARLDAGEAAPVSKKAQIEKPAVKLASTPISTPTISTPTQVAAPEAAEKVVPVSKPLTPQKPQQVEKLEQELQSSESELSALEEKNHRLRLMLAEVQTEVDGLKEELGDENRIRTEVEKLLEAERQRLALQQSNAPSALDNILSNGWLVAALAVIPGLLIGLIVMLLLGRKKSEEQQHPFDADQAAMMSAGAMAPLAAEALNDDVEDELDLDDDLFGESSDDDALFADELDALDSSNDDADIFADLNEHDLDFNLGDGDDNDPFAAIGDDGDLDESLTSFDVSSNGISVDSNEKALGLEEMERALDDVNLEASSEEESDFDLSDATVSQSDLDDLFNSVLDNMDDDEDSSEQAMLDELLSDSAEGDVAFSFDNLLDDPEAFDLSDDEPDMPSKKEDLDSAASGEDLSDFDIDALFDQVSAEKEQEEAALAREIPSNEQKVDDVESQFDVESHALFDELFAETDEKTVTNTADSRTLDEMLDAGIDDFDLSSDTESVDLLDDWLDAEEEDDVLQLPEGSTATLDELLDESEHASDADNADDNTTVVEPAAEHSAWEMPDLIDDDITDDADVLDQDSTSMLDELLDEEALASPSNEQTVDADSTDLLDELLNENSATDENGLDSIEDDFGDDSLALFEELLEIESGQSSDDRDQSDVVTAEDSLATLEATDQSTSNHDNELERAELPPSLDSEGNDPAVSAVDERTDEENIVPEPSVESPADSERLSDDVIDDTLDSFSESQPNAFDAEPVDDGAHEEAENNRELDESDLNLEAALPEPEPE
ncbi:FimV/HubP family polar landmark protein, partial [Vibrio renipiscarius]|uniref:FimV/HubP family polar landmark protein n=1 Tax=Vibrio renipiscarius TaxID=1461322 RepID=UPI00354EEFFD